MVCFSSTIVKVKSWFWIVLASHWTEIVNTVLDSCGQLSFVLKLPAIMFLSRVDSIVIILILPMLRFKEITWIEYGWIYVKYYDN